MQRTQQLTVNNQYTSLSQVARLEGVNKSTLFRYIKRNPELIHGYGKQGSFLINADEVRKHRTANLRLMINPTKGRGHLPTDDAAYTKARTQREVIRAERDAMDLKLKKGELIERHEAEDVIAEVARLFQTLMKRMNRVLARRFRVKPRELDRAYKTVMDQMQQEFSNRYNA